MITAEVLVDCYSVTARSVTRGPFRTYRVPHVSCGVTQSKSLLRHDACAPVVSAFSLPFSWERGNAMWVYV